MDKFANSLDSDVKKDPKAIETEFRIFCKDTKGRENRLVCKKSKWISIAVAF